MFENTLLDVKDVAFTILAVFLFFLYFFRELFADIARFRGMGLPFWSALVEAQRKHDVDRVLSHRPGHPQNEMYELAAVDRLPSVTPSRQLPPENSESASIEKQEIRANND